MERKEKYCNRKSLFCYISRRHEITEVILLNYVLGYAPVLHGIVSKGTRSSLEDLLK